MILKKEFLFQTCLVVAVRADKPGLPVFADYPWWKFLFKVSESGQFIIFRGC